MGKKLLQVGVVAVMVLAFAACGVFKKEKSSTLTPEERVKLDQTLATLGPPAEVDIGGLPELTPDKIRTAFDENPLNAGRMYENQWLKVRGKLVLGPLKTEVAGITIYTLGIEHSGKQIFCAFVGKPKEEALAQLRKGQTIVVVGRYVSSPQGPGLGLCSLVEGGKKIP